MSVTCAGSVGSGSYTASILPLPRSCSGARWDGVPTSAPDCVVSWSSSFATSTGFSMKSSAPALMAGSCQMVRPSLTNVNETSGCASAARDSSPSAALERDHVLRHELAQDAQRIERLCGVRLVDYLKDSL